MERSIVRVQFDRPEHQVEQRGVGETEVDVRAAKGCQLASRSRLGDLA
ncbi:MAG TPA: hypothetical protein VGD09_07645 [Blastococcus sp.]